MLDDIALLDPVKGRDLLGRLGAKHVDQVLPAEMELALLWAMAQLGAIDIEPEMPNGNRPEAYSEVLIPGRPAVIEITAPWDNGISGEAAMDRVASEIINCANQARRGVGSHLYFRFGYTNDLRNVWNVRRRLAPEEYRLSETARASVTTWVSSGARESERLRIDEPGLSVEVEWTARKQLRHHNTWSSVPVEAHGVDTNPLWDALRRKLRQVRATDQDVLRLIFLADGGATLLNQIGAFGEMDHLRRRTSGTEIITEFVSRHSSRVDAVVVFAPVRQGSVYPMGELIWRVTPFVRPGLELPLEGIERMASLLPRPWFEGYQVRSLFRQGTYRQGLYDPAARGWYSGMRITSEMKGPIRVKVSARAILDFLAGRITPERFALELGQRDGQPNQFDQWLRMGKTLSAIEFEEGGLDEDDDSVVLTLSDDPAARPFRLSTPEAGN